MIKSCDRSKERSCGMYSHKDIIAFHRLTSTCSRGVGLVLRVYSVCLGMFISADHHTWMYRKPMWGRNGSEHWKRLLFLRKTQFRILQKMSRISQRTLYFSELFSLVWSRQCILRKNVMTMHQQDVCYIWRRILWPMGVEGYLLSLKIHPHCPNVL